jgi:hypothetical protein
MLLRKKKEEEKRKEKSWFWQSYNNPVPKVYLFFSKNS